jgi:hypothetical protein
MITEIENEADELLIGTAKAISNSEALGNIQSMPEVSHALEKILQMHGQNPHKVVQCAFLLGVYLGLQYHDMKVWTGEK